MAIKPKNQTVIRKPVFSSLGLIPARNENREIQTKIIKAYRQTHPGTTKVSPVLINKSVAAPLNTIVNLNVNPGDQYFIFWYSISVYFPLIAACLGPLANMISLIALIDDWRLNLETGEITLDTRTIKSLNAVSLAMGLLGNVSFIMNFSRILHYTITQIASIFFWLAASVLQLATIIISNREFRSTSNPYHPSDGFWFGVFTCFFYFCCACILGSNYIGYKLNKYPASFNLTPNQRKLMVYTVFFAIWAIIGCVVMQKLITGLTFGSSLYFCVVSFLTVGLGDILPSSSGSKVMVMFFSLGGVVIMGLVVSKIRQVIASSSGPTIFWHQIELKRNEFLQKIKAENTPLTKIESFKKMRQIKEEAKQTQLNISLAITLTILLLFWFIGGLVFHFVEGWNYFNSIYFCFMCLITIGYGDFAPVTPLGRVFFISWSISAVPLMTILISNIGDKIFYSGSVLKDVFSRIFFFSHIQKLLYKWKNTSNRTETDHTANSLSDHTTIEDTEKTISSFNGNRSLSSLTDYVLQSTATCAIEQHTKLVKLLYEFKDLKTVLLDTIEDPEKVYDLHAWNKILDEPDTDHPRSEFYWLEKDSPFTLPLREPQYFLSRGLQKIEAHIEDIIALDKITLDNLVKQDNNTKN